MIMLKKDSFNFSVRFCAFSLCFCVMFSALLFFCGADAFYETPAYISSVLFVQTEARPRPVVVIDAGHGGEDGGATSDSGLCEKDINLKICKILAALCDSAGVDCIMTRTDDVMLTDGAAAGHKKLQDLKNRVRTAKENEPCVFVSIHQNKFPQKKYTGLQVYYSVNSPYSQLLAGGIQSAVKLHIQHDNTREIKPATSAIYVLDRLSVPAVLVECGFLSNDAEAARLDDTDYQKQLAAAIFSAVFNFKTYE